MDKDEDAITHEQSFGIIEQMIAAAKNEHREKGDGWLVWGWLLFISSLASAVCITMGYNNFVGWIWAAMAVTGVTLGFALSFKKKKKDLVVTYVQDLLIKLGAGFFISLFVMIAASYLTQSYYAFGYYYILYAFWMFIHGSAIHFRPLIFGAFINWAAALAIFLTKDNFLSVMIISSVAILAGYLIPGYMLRNQFKKTHQPKSES